jgi:hypothetical protein
MNGVRNPLLAALFNWLADKLEARLSKAALTH